MTWRYVILWELKGRRGEMQVERKSYSYGEITLTHSERIGSKSADNLPYGELLRKTIRNFAFHMPMSEY